MFFFFFFDENKEKLVAAAKDEKAVAIIQSEEFYFQKAIDKFEELKKIVIEKEIIEELINQTKVKPFSFEKLLSNYDTESSQYNALKVIGEFISYADSNDAMKNALNKYEDKRTMAQLSVRQNIWVQSLLRLKNDEDINLLPVSIKNVLNYIETPDRLLSVFSAQRKEAILKAFESNSDMDLLQYMRETGIKSNNPMNDGVLYSVIFHSKEIRQIWDDKEGIQKRVWSYSPGKDACMWDRFFTDGIIAIDYDIGDLREYNSKEDIKNSYKPNENPMNDILALWQFCREMQTGDRVYVKSGQNVVIGVGEVESEYGYD